jgi:hypothetical protein
MSGACSSNRRVIAAPLSEAAAAQRTFQFKIVVEIALLPMPDANAIYGTQLD